MKLKNIFRKNKIIFLLPIILVIFFIIFKIKNAYLYHLFIAEDGPVEWLQFTFFLLASIFSFLTALSFFKKKNFWLGSVFFILSFGLFFVAGEEISWGQRILGIATPEEIAQKNVQNETTIHNLDFFQGKLPQIYILIGLWGSFGWIIVSKFKKRLLGLKNFSPQKIFLSISSLFFFIILGFSI